MGKRVAFPDSPNKFVRSGNDPVLYTLREKRVQANLSQSDVADVLGVTKQCYSQMERGIQALSYKCARTLARMLNTTTEDLFEKDYRDQTHYGA